MSNSPEQAVLSSIYVFDSFSCVSVCIITFSPI